VLKLRITKQPKSKGLQEVVAGELKLGEVSMFNQYQSRNREVVLKLKST
jgi:hypothetical protein